MGDQTQLNSESIANAAVRALGFDKYGPLKRSEMKTGGYRQTLANEGVNVSIDTTTDGNQSSTAILITGQDLARPLDIDVIRTDENNIIRVTEKPAPDATSAERNRAPYLRIASPLGKPLPDAATGIGRGQTVEGDATIIRVANSIRRLVTP